MEFLKRKLMYCFALVFGAIAQSFRCNASGFDSIGGTYDDQTGFAFDKMNWIRMRTANIFGLLSSDSERYTKFAGAGPTLDGTGIIVRRQIDSGDEVRYTMQEHMKGTGSFGTLPYKRGEFLRWKQTKARVNKVKSPSIPIQSEEDQKRVLASITNIPESARKEVIEWHGDEYEFEAFQGIIEGASDSVLKTTAEGGLGHSLGVGAGGGAGVPLMCKNFYTPDTGFIAYNSTVATYNGLVNDAINGIDADAADMVTLNALEMIISNLDDIKFWRPTVGGVQYKAIMACDPALYLRINNLLRAYQKDALPRAKNHPIFQYTSGIEFLDCLFLNAQNLKKLRPAYSSTLGRPLFGPSTTQYDHRDYVTSSTNALMLILGARAILEGYRESIKIVDDTGRFKDGMEIASNGNYGFTRGEFYAQDGETGADACVNHSTAVCAFYEPGVGVNY